MRQGAGCWVWGQGCCWGGGGGGGGGGVAEAGEGYDITSFITQNRTS